MTLEEPKICGRSGEMNAGGSGGRNTTRKPTKSMSLRPRGSQRLNSQPESLCILTRPQICVTGV